MKLRIVKQTICRTERYVIVSNKPNNCNGSKFVIAFTREASAKKMVKFLKAEIKAGHL